MKHDLDQEIEDQTNDQTDRPQPEVAEAGAAEPSASQETAQAADAELAEWKQKAEENYQRFLRTQADFDNFRRRARQEKEEFAKYASQKVIEALLPIADNFERAIAASKEQTDSDSLLKGVDMIFRQLSQLLESEGVKPIEAVGQPFNPELHQAVMQVETPEGGESGTVVEELQRGYTMYDKVLRPSMVKVSE